MKGDSNQIKSLKWVNTFSCNILTLRSCQNPKKRILENEQNFTYEKCQGSWHSGADSA